MKLPSLALWITLACIACTNGQPKQTSSDNHMAIDLLQDADKFEYTFETAHPNAQLLMKEDFYWSPIEEAGPFGSDDGSDAAYGFRKWRIVNRDQSPVTYLKDLMAKWKYPYFDWNEMDSGKIKDFLESKVNLTEADIEQRVKQLKEASKRSLLDMDDEQLREIVISASQDMGGMFLVGQDNAIIGTGFAQFALEGRIDSELRALAIIALKRQLLPVLIDGYDKEYRDKRKEQLTKMLVVITNL